jgi:hypothetical protein
LFERLFQTRFTLLDRSLTNSLSRVTDSIQIDLIAYQARSSISIMSFAIRRPREPVIVPALEPVIVPALDPVMVPALDPVIVPALDPVIVPALDPVMVPALDPVMVPTLLVREPVMVPANDAVESERVSITAAVVA